MAKYIVARIISALEMVEVEVSDEFPGDAEREAKYRASAGGGDVIEDHPASGYITPLDWDNWEIEQVE